MESESVHIGTSGWNYPHWKESFYPSGLPQERWLEYYTRSLRSVEINNSFYQLPAEKTLMAWRDGVPGDFIFSVKASRYITHMKKLKDPGESLGRFLDRISVLGDRLGPILFQLPPKWKVNPQRLTGFLEHLPSDFHYAFEFRDPSWFHPEIYRALLEKGAAFCIYHLAGLLSPKNITAEFAYVRLHGPGDKYQGKYDEETLSGWAGAFSTWKAQGKEIFCYFDNDEKGYAAANALRLQEMLAR